MIVTRDHALALERLLAGEEAGRPWTPVEEIDDSLFYELEMSGLARYETPIRIAPTYFGRELALLLRRMARPLPAAEAHAQLVPVALRILPPPAEWPEGWRWIGSEVATLLQAADRAGQVGPQGVEVLAERGFAAKYRDRDTGRETWMLTEGGRRVLEIWREIEPGLEISDSLASFIRKVPAGPAPASELPTGSHEEHLLEAMRLIAYSAPQSDTYAFTGLGLAVRRALAAGGFGEGDVLTADLLLALAAVADGRAVPAAGRETLQTLGYVDSEGDLTPAGEAGLEALRLLRDGPSGEVWTFAIEAEEVAVLETVADLTEKGRQDPDQGPLFANIRRRMIDARVREYEDLLRRYGRRLDEMPEKYRQIAARFAETRDLARWYDDNFDLRETLKSLESFGLVRVEADPAGREVYAPGPHAAELLADQRTNRRDVAATAVKAVTLPRHAFAAPASDWYALGREQSLLGTGEPTASGELYARLAETIHRRPHLSRWELQVFHVLPARGMTLDELHARLDPLVGAERVRWAVEKLEARHFIDVLPDGNIVETEAGMQLDRALSGVPAGFGNPVDPLICRLLEALRAVGTLYVRERKIRVLPRNIKEALRLSGLPKEVFDNALEAARVAGLVGRNSINEAGLSLLEVFRSMNPREAAEPLRH